MKQIITLLIICFSSISFSQEKDKVQELAIKRANDYVYEGNNLIEEDFVLAEMEYRKAISEESSSVAGTYNLANAYIKNGNAPEALFRLEQAAKAATSKNEKHKAFHNMGNVLMQNEKCKEAVEAYKNALRNNPIDDETRYNLSVAKACAEEQKQQEDQNKDDQNDENQEDKDNKEDQENKDQEGDNEEDQNDQGEDEQKEDDKNDDDGKPEDDKKDEGKEGEDKKEKPQQPKPQPGQLSPQQIKNLLEAMNNQEQKVQEKMNAEKQKGVIIKTDKDW
ncbi:tetratricopeptide repeat protein [Cognatitamlana onchidii]|uniref:tetratricopeptide repeat protein n=1 Tax=Cognatitamlana onchidii TaxID=2562860 RepID=UPI0010A629AD|nr:tetratricopeptide repeat protein [Algibacter onchidii]